MFITKEKLAEKLDNRKNLVRILGIEEECVSLAVVENTVVENTVVDETVDEVVVEKINSGETRHTGKGGRIKGDKNIPQEIRDIIAIQTAVMSQADIAKQWGISQGQVSNIKLGHPNINSRGFNPDSPSNVRTKEVVEGNLEKIRKRVEEKILVTLEFMTEGKLMELDARNLSIVTRNLANTVKDAENTGEKFVQNNVQTIFYNPGQQSIENYEIIDAIK